MPRKKPIKTFPILTVDAQEEAGHGRWFRLRRWQTSNFVMMLNETPLGWQVFSKEEKVAGVTFENRETTFFSICLEQGFRIYLQREEDNVEDSKAIRVMGTCDTFPYGYHLGYLERETAYTGRFTGEMITKGFVVIETGNGYTLFESLNPPVGVFPINGISVRTRVRLTQIPQGNSTRVVATVTMRNQAPGGQAVDYPVVSGRSDMRDVQAILLRCAGQ